jgi:hypothetical protein
MKKRYKVHCRDTKTVPRRNRPVYVEIEGDEQAAIKHIEENNGKGQEFDGLKPHTAYFAGDVRKKKGK